MLYRRRGFRQRLPVKRGIVQKTHEPGIDYPFQFPRIEAVRIDASSAKLCRLRRGPIGDLLSEVIGGRLHDAALYRKSLAKASAPVEQKPQPQPVRKVGSSAPAAKDPDKMSTEEWMKWRNAQVRKTRTA